MTLLYDAVLAQTRLKATQFVLLHTISKYGSVAQWKLAQDHAIAVETLSRRLAGMREKGLLRLSIGERRGEHVYQLTPAGEKELAEAMPYWERAQSRLRQTLGAGDFERAIELADRITHAALEAESLKIKNVSTGDSE